jgi:malonyl-CoA O-methyltransferase
MIEQRFSAAAKTYDRHARPQQALAQSLILILPSGVPSRILELGSGTGQLTRRLAEHFPKVPIDAVDVAEKMVEHSRVAFENYSQIKWVVGDAQTYLGVKPYPLIVSSSALHWVSDLTATFKNIYRNLESGGVFALGLMLEGTLKELHALRSQVAPEKTPATTLPSYETTKMSLEKAGFILERRKHSEEEIIYADAQAFLKAIHEQGVTSGKVSTGNAPLTRSELIQLTALYQENCATTHGVYATYETATFLLSKV